MKTIHDFLKAKESKEPITMTTCYDYWSAKLLDESQMDCILVGDSLAQVMHGHPSTLQADTEVIALHVAAVSRGAPNKFIIGDMPFLSVRKGLEPAMNSVDKIMKAGAHCVKIEGIQGHEEIIKHIVESGVPVMGHLGLTPQSVHQLGGYKVQGKDQQTYDFIFQSALKLQDLGCFALVLECVPEKLAREITTHLKIPVIGIGAGIHVDGQVLVLQDLLGFNSGHRPKFLRNFSNGSEFFSSGIQSYVSAVKKREYPAPEEVYL